MLMYKNYLFDLDGTLLPMDMEKFVKLYFSSLCKRCTPVIKIEPDALIKAMWAGTDAMTKNDNSRTNREVFWETAGKVSGADLEKFDDLFTDYYENEFIVPKDATSFTPYAKKSIDFIKKNGGRLIAATSAVVAGSAGVIQPAAEVDHRCAGVVFQVRPHLKGKVILPHGDLQRTEPLHQAAGVFLCL